MDDLNFKRFLSSNRCKISEGYDTTDMAMEIKTEPLLLPFGPTP